MDLAKYQELTGITVATANEAFITAQLSRSQSLLENMLGYTLDPLLVDENQYDEAGKSVLECPSSIDLDTLNPADAIVGAYRLFDYNSHDVYFHIDPASQINAVKLVVGNVTVKTLDPDEYRIVKKNGMILYIEKIIDCCFCLCDSYCSHSQLAVDAEWLWPNEEEIPTDLLLLWADMTTYYSDRKNNIKSETLGTHSYNKFEKTVPQEEEMNVKILKKYAGGNGSIIRNNTL